MDPSFEKASPSTQMEWICGTYGNIKSWGYNNEVPAYEEMVAFFIQKYSIEKIKHEASEQLNEMQYSRLTGLSGNLGQRHQVQMDFLKMVIESGEFPKVR